MVAGLLQKIEDRLLLLRGRGGFAEQTLRRMGRYLETLEGLLPSSRDI